MVNKIFLSGLLLLAVYNVPAQSIKRLDGTTISTDSLTKAIERLTSVAEVHGMALSVFNNGRAVYKKTFGYRNANTKLPLQGNTNIYGASLSKAVFAVLVMKLVEEKVLSLDRPLQSYLPQPVYTYTNARSWNEDYSDLKNDTLYQKITARMCLDHTSGFPNWRWDNPDQKLRVAFMPGDHYSYSGEGLCYLQFVIQKITGKTLEELMQKKIFDPLHIKFSAYTWLPAYETNYSFGHDSKGTVLEKDKDNAPRAASTLETTPDDYTRFLEALLQGKILKKSSYNEMFSTQVRIRSRYQMGPEAWKDSTHQYDYLKLGYGLGWGVLHTPKGVGVFKEGHGNGFQHYTILFPSQKMGIMLLTNSDNGEKVFKEILQTAIGDMYTPWEWQRYIPYNTK